ncbi:34175_t:CDS:1, partial [Racocetra persica]
ALTIAKLTVDQINYVISQIPQQNQSYKSRGRDLEGHNHMITAS